MIDMALTIAPKSDQLTADDLRGGPRTVSVTRVSADMSNPDQPIAINYEGDDGKPFKPCKTMRRMMMYAWGQDASAYVGRSMTLYCDPKVRFGPDTPGGVRISHMSHIDAAITKALLSTKGKYKQHTVSPLKVADATPDDEDTRPDAEAFVAGFIGALANRATIEAVAKLQNSRKAALADLAEAFPDLGEQASAAVTARLAEIEAMEPAE